MNIVKVCTIPSGDKYSHAKKWKIPCVTSAWVFDSIERGHCLPPDLYRVDRQAKTGNELDQRLAEVSILNPDVSVKKRVDDTINTTAVLAEIKSADCVKKNSFMIGFHFDYTYLSNNLPDKKSSQKPYERCQSSIKVDLIQRLLIICNKKFAFDSQFSQSQIPLPKFFIYI